MAIRNILAAPQLPAGGNGALGELHRLVDGLFRRHALRDECGD